MQALTTRDDVKFDKGDAKSVDKRIAILEQERQKLDEQQKLFAEETVKASKTIEMLDNDVERLTPYKVRVKLM